MLTYFIDVTRRHTCNGKYESTECPLAAAIKDTDPQLNNWFSEVLQYTLELVIDNQFLSVLFPSEITEKIQLYDDNKGMFPFFFYLYLNKENDKWYGMIARYGEHPKEKQESQQLSYL